MPTFHYLYGKVRDLLLVLFCNFLPNSLIFDQDGEDRLDAGPTVDGYVRLKNRHEWGGERIRPVKPITRDSKSYPDKTREPEGTQRVKQLIS